MGRAKMDIKAGAARALHAQLEALREEEVVSKDEWCERLGIARSTYRRLAQDGPPALGTLNQIAKSTVWTRKALVAFLRDPDAFPLAGGVG